MIIVKIGGSEGTGHEAICADLARHIQSGRRIIVVHGGSHDTNVLSEALGHPPRFVTSVSGHTSRYTDRRTMEIFMMAVAGKMNTLIVENLQRLGVNALGLSGIDGRLLQAKRKDAIRIIEDGKKKMLRDDYTGKIEQVNTELLRALLEAGYTPVIAPIALADTGDAVNCDGDRAAAMIAGALDAETYVNFTNVPGLLKDIDDPNSLIREIPRGQLEKFEAYAQGRMKKKIMGAQEALDGGVKEIRLASGKAENPLANALAGECTVIG
ncbi:[LysW]-aminoadipate kinase [Candidatus Sumerlaeota bacterium]|nr:[LysW]-aminoadipate kinase [Candidatus Sumerlaeota bacterium]